MDKDRASRLIDAAMGRISCDTVIRNARVVDVFNRMMEQLEPYRSRFGRGFRAFFRSEEDGRPAFAVAVFLRA